MQLAKDKANDYFLTKPGVDQSRFCVCEESERIQLKRKLALPEDKQIVLFVGRFVKAKGVDLLIEAMKELHANCHLVLVGGGDEREFFIAHINAMGLMKQVSIVDPLRTVEDYYRCADVFVMSSRYEPLGQTLLEAFSSELSASSLAIEISAQLDSVSEERRVQVSQAAKLKFSWAKLYTDLIS
jgi:glycosyltransferase involved in cell wall biosynthesis